MLSFKWYFGSIWEYLRYLLMQIMVLLHNRDYCFITKDWCLLKRNDVLTNDCIYCCPLYDISPLPHNSFVYFIQWGNRNYTLICNLGFCMISSKIIIIIITELRPRNQTLLINCPEINYQNSIVKNFIVIILFFLVQLVS